MHPQRRLKFFVIVTVAVLLILYYSNEVRTIENHRFYRTTVEAMDSREAAKHATKDDDGVFRRLQPDKQAAGEQPVVMDSGSKDENAPLDNGNGNGDNKVAEEGSKEASQSQSKDTIVSQEKAQEAKEAEQKRNDLAKAKEELNGILKRSPIVIFSKSYCPHSARAKSIILDKYSVVPAPQVVELNLHPLGARLQEVLAESTGRRTVPNVLVNGKSVGGGDDVAALDKKGELASTLKTLGGNWVTEVKTKERKDS